MKVLRSQPAQRTMAATAQPSSAQAAGAPVVIPARLIQEGEEVVLALKPSGLFVLLASAPFILAVAIVAAGGYTIDTLGVAQLRLQWLAMGCVAAVVIRLLVGLLQWLSRVYVLTNRRVIRVKGVLRIHIFECPLSRIQNTVLSLSVSERLFGLGTIAFATAGTGRMEAGWVMISRPIEVHEIVVEYIRRAQGSGAAKEL